MNMSFFTAAVGAQQQQHRMDAQGNNIANINTYGYKTRKAAFYQLMNRSVTGIDGAQLPKGTGSVMGKATTDFAFAGLADTGRSLDFAIEGEGFFGLFDPASGEISFTKDGSFVMSEYRLPPEENAPPNPDGSAPEPRVVWRLSDGEGRCVLDRQGNFITLTSPEDEVSIGVFDYPVRDGLLRTSGGRFLPTEQNGQVYLTGAEVKRGYLERSNVDLAEEMTKVIESQRAYSYALKMVQTSDEVETTINGLRG